MNPHVRVAAEEDIPVLITLYAEVKEWATKKGHRQTTNCTPRELRTQIKKATVYFCEDNEPGAVASFSLVDMPAKSMIDLLKAWTVVPEVSLDLENTLSLKWLAVARRRWGEGLGFCVLDKACEIVHEKGRTFCFLDCWAGNAKLRAYYSSAGFRFAGIAKKKEDENFRISFFLRDC